MNAYLYYDQCASFPDPQAQKRRLGIVHNTKDRYTDTLNSLVHTEKYFIGNHFIMRGRGLGMRLEYEAGN